MKDKTPLASVTPVITVYINLKRPKVCGSHRIKQVPVAKHKEWGVGPAVFKRKGMGARKYIPLSETVVELKI